jgi:hypothetical protein
MREDTSRSRLILPMFCTTRLILAKGLSAIVNSIDRPCCQGGGTLQSRPFVVCLPLKISNAGTKKSFFLPGGKPK